MADPDLQISVGGGGGGGGGVIQHPNPEITRHGLQTVFFSALRASAWSKNTGGGGGAGFPGPFPRSASSTVGHCVNEYQSPSLLSKHLIFRGMERSDF